MEGSYGAHVYCESVLVFCRVGHFVVETDREDVLSTALSINFDIEHVHALSKSMIVM